MNLFKKKEPMELYSPVIGEVIALEKVPDRIFSKKILGDGVGLSFESDMIYSPCDGEITAVAPTKHAIGIKTKTGVELMIHVGLDTVNLNGEGLEPLVSPGTKVKAHMPIMKIDRLMMEKNKINLVTPMVITNMEEFEVHIMEPQSATLETVVLVVKRS